MLIPDGSPIDKRPAHDPHHSRSRVEHIGVPIGCANRSVLVFLTLPTATRNAISAGAGMRDNRADSGFDGCVGRTNSRQILDRFSTDSRPILKGTKMNEQFSSIVELGLCT